MTSRKILFPLAIVFVLAAFSFAGCDTEDEPIPAFLKLDEFVVQATNPNVHGSVSSKVSHAKVFFRDLNTGETHALGVLPLPGTYPVLLEGDYEVNIDPVIKANGNSLSAVIYPFYERYTAVVNLVANEDTEVSPTTRYVDNASFEFVEGFENGVHIFSDDRDENPLTFIERSDLDVFEGNYSGHVHLDTANNTFVVSSISPFTLSVSEQGKIFMEVNYKTGVPLEFGVIAVDAQGVEEPNYAFYVFEKEDWNKIYFDLTELIASANTDRFYILIRGILPFDGGEFTKTEADVWLDNVKLVHF